MLFILNPLTFQNQYLFLQDWFRNICNITKQYFSRDWKVGDAGNTNAMLTAFRLSGLILGPFIFAYFVNLGNITSFLFVSLVSLLGISIMRYKMKNKILPQVRFWSKDS